MQPQKAPRRSRRSGNPRKCQAQGPTHNASPAVLPEAWRGRGRWLRAGGGSEARTPVPALLAPRCVLQFRLHTQPCANSGRPSPAPTQVALRSARLSYTCDFRAVAPRGHAFPLSLQLSPHPPLSSSPFAYDSRSPSRTSVPTHTHTHPWAPSPSPHPGVSQRKPTHLTMAPGCPPPSSL